MTDQEIQSEIDQLEALEKRVHARRRALTDYDGDIVELIVALKAFRSDPSEDNKRFLKRAREAIASTRQEVVPPRIRTDINHVRGRLPHMWNQKTANAVERILELVDL